MWIFLVFLFSLSVFALESFDKIPGVKILKTFPENIILINRGVEDGIQKNDHIKLISESGYAARALCLQARMETSYWKLYRVAQTELISMDESYSIVGLGSSEIPSSIEKLRDQNIEIKEQSSTIAKKTNPFSVKGDLPEKLTERDLIENKDHNIIGESVNSDQMARELSSYKLSLYASPFTRQSINNAQNYRYGFKGSNAGTKYRLLTQFERQESSFKDPLTKESVRTKMTQAQAQFVIHRISNALSTVSLVNYNSIYFSRLGTPKDHWQYGPLGFTWHLMDDKNWEFVDLSYIPLIDRRGTDLLENNQKRTENKSGLRHGFRLGMKRKITETVAFENLLWVRPYQDLGSMAVELNNLNLVNDLKLVFHLSGNFFLDYNLIYQHDSLWRDLSGLPASNTINSLNFRYDLNL